MEWLTWKTFWKFAPYIGAALALLGAVWYIDHRGYQRSENKAKLQKLEEDNTRLELKNYINKRVGDVEDDLDSIISEVDTKLKQRLSQLDIEERTIVQPTIVKEIQNEARYRDPDGLTDGVFRALNKARSASSGTCTSEADGSISCTLPPSNSPEGQDPGNPVH